MTNSGANTATFIDLTANSPLTSITVGQFPRGVAINPVTNIAVVVNSNSNNVSIVDLGTQTVKQTIGVGAGPTGVAIHQLTNTAIVTNSGVVRGVLNASAPTTVSIIDLGLLQVSQTVPVGSAAYGVDVAQSSQIANRSGLRIRRHH